MDKKSKKQKRVARKIEQLEKLEEASKNFDILNILQNERLDSKPNLGKFIQTYIKEIRAFNYNKISFYPEFKYDIDKIFVRFLDNHELIYDKTNDRFFLYLGCDEIPLKEKEIPYIRTFFDFLIQFKFVY